MSLFKLFLSGLLVAGGLILGAFTLHGYLDPQWAQRQAQAQAASVKPPEPAPDTPSVNAFQDRSKFVARTEPRARGQGACGGAARRQGQRQAGRGRCQGRREACTEEEGRRASGG